MMVQPRNPWMVVVAVMMLTAGVSARQPGGQPGGPPPGQADLAAGNAAFERQDWPAAVEVYTRAHAAGMDHGMLHFRLGYALHVTGKPAEALPHHLQGAHMTHRALRIDCLYNAACACALLGRPDDAVAWLERAVDAGFEDRDQLARDTDLDSLRPDPRFTAIADGIGTAPRLHQWMDFFVGEWTCLSAMGPGQRPEEVLTLAIARPLESSHTLTTASVQAARPGQPAPSAPHWAGSLYPDAAARAWLWVYTDNLGTRVELRGERVHTGAGAPWSMRFSGRQVSPAGPGAHVRLTFTARPDGRVGETTEVSEDGRTWRTHHEAEYVKKSAAPEHPPAK